MIKQVVNICITYRILNKGKWIQEIIGDTDIGPITTEMKEWGTLQKTDLEIKKNDGK